MTEIISTRVSESMAKDLEEKRGRSHVGLINALCLLGIYQQAFHLLSLS